MELEVEINRKDFVKFNQYILKKKRALWHKFVTPSILVLFVILLNINKISNISYIIAQVLIVLIIYYLFILILKPIFALRIKYLPSEKGSSLGKRKFKISDEGLCVTTANSESLRRWDGFQSIEKTKDYIYLFVDTHVAYIIPIRYFKSPEEYADFYSTIKSRIESTKKKTPVN